MTDRMLAELAQAAGLAPRWHDFKGRPHDVAPDTLRAVLLALGLPAQSEAAIRESQDRLRQEAAGLPPLITADADAAVQLPGRLKVMLEGGGTAEGIDAVHVDVPGYHRLETPQGEATLAVAPARAQEAPDRSWGIAVQLYSLRRAGDGGIGDFGALRDFARAAAARGADAVAISPVHAQFSADPDRFSPYAPSSRIMLNVLHTDPPQGDAALEALDLVDWPAAARARMAQFRAAFAQTGETAELTAFRRARGDALERHATFEALHAHFFGRDPALWHWRAWPDPFRQADSPEVLLFAAENGEDVAFHAWLQMQAERGLGAAQEAARAAGMRVGLIADLAVGTDGGGSHAWSRQNEMLIGLTVGAPPDLLNTKGQNWGIGTFSPAGLARHGFGAFIEMLSAALRHSGGVRIDHAMGLQRLWVIPDGAGGHEGVYLRFPFTDMLRLAKLESHRAGGIVVAEDLGTVPEGFSEQLEAAAVYGMRVLWFEQWPDGLFKRPKDWAPGAVAMTTTHDLATVAGWWRGHDIDLRHGIGFVPDLAAAQAERAAEKSVLWDAFRDSGAATGDPPPAEHGAAVADAACAHVASSACRMALIPIEDILARVEQPNLPGSIDEHPNWRRRLPGPAGSLLDPSDVDARTRSVANARRMT